jgi:threonine/homoserine efflux transporter RhtA
MAKSKTDRSKQITLRLEPKIHDGLTQLSDKIGVAATTIAALAIGEYVAKNLQAGEHQKLMVTTIGTEMAKVLAGPLGHLFEGKTPEELKALFEDD